MQSTQPNALEDYKETLKDNFPVYVDGIGEFDTIIAFIKYCNISRNVLQKIYNDNPIDWVEIAVAKDTGPFYLGDKEYPNRSTVAREIGLTNKSLADQANVKGYECIQDYLDYMYDNKAKYNGKVIYNSSTLSEATGLDIMTCTGIMRLLLSEENVEDKTSKLAELVNNRKQIIKAVNRIDPTVNSVTDFRNKYNLNSYIMRVAEETNLTFEERVEYLSRKMLENRNVAI